MSFVRTLLSSNLSPSLKFKMKQKLNKIKLQREFNRDTIRFSGHSTALQPIKTRSQWRGHLIFEYHRIEKGLALPIPRSGFGKETVLKLIKDLNFYQVHFGFDDMTEIIESIFLEYNNFIKKDGICIVELDDYLSSRQVSLSAQKGGSLLLNHSELFPVPTEIADQFISSRRSVRQFTGQPVPVETIEAVVRLAQNAPSVCNRQSGHVFCVNETEKIARVLVHQNGNRGFGHQIGAALIVTSDVEKFHTLGERNQPYVDGGIFAMSLVQALHAHGLGACMLNWSVEQQADNALREEFSLPEGHVVITMIGCGYAVDPVRVAMSPRDPVDRVLSWL